MMHGRPINQISCRIEERGIIWVIDQDSRKRLDFFEDHKLWPIGFNDSGFYNDAW